MWRAGLIVCAVVVQPWSACYSLRSAEPVVSTEWRSAIDGSRACVLVVRFPQGDVLNFTTHDYICAR